MLPKFRQINSAQETLNALNLCIAESHKFCVWQSIDDKKSLCQAVVISVTQSTPFVIEIRFDKGFKLDLSKEIFLFQDKLSFLFKGKIYNQAKNSISIAVESKYYLKEKRGSSRFKFENVSFDVFFDYIEQSTRLKKSFRAELVDISETGLCFTVPAHKGVLFYEEMVLCFKALESIKFHKPIMGSIVYLKSSKTKFGQTDLKFGVSFKERSTAIKAAMKLFNDKRQPAVSV